MKTCSEDRVRKIRDAAEQLKTTRPACRSRVDYCTQVCCAQEYAKSDLNLEPLALSKERLRARREAGLPLLGSSEFKIDPDASRRLFEILCKLACQANPQMQAPVGKISDRVAQGQLDLDTAFAAFLKAGESGLKKIADGNEVHGWLLSYLVYNSVKPSLSRCAEQLFRHVPDENAWGKGACPVCGALPCISLLAKDGRRRLFCGFCWCQWAIQMASCPICGNQDIRSLEDFDGRQEPEYRLYACKLCKTYIKTVDTRNTKREIYPPLEASVTVHLDWIANEKGYKTNR